MKYMPTEMNGICRASIKINAMTEASTTRSVLLRRPGVGWRSFSRARVHEIRGTAYFVAGVGIAAVAMGISVSAQL